MTFRILSWNINGLRSFKTDMKEFLTKLDADIICFQETKVTRDMLEEPHCIVEGFSSYFSFSRKRSGYSGVATFCSEKATPIHAQEGLSGTLVGSLLENSGTPEELPGHWVEEELSDLDKEGRAIITQHTLKGQDKPLAVINVYCPRADPEKPERKIYKLKFYELLRQRAATLSKAGSHVIIVGDVNTSHKRIDHCDPDENEDFELRLGRRYLDKFLVPLHKDDDVKVDKTVIKALEDSSCQSLPLSEHRPKTSAIKDAANHSEKLDDSDCIDEGLDEYLLESATDFQMVDTFRYFYPQRQNAFTCWNTFTNARATNYGTRIDYIFCDKLFLPFIEDSSVLQDVMGSDHCPVAVKVIGEITPSRKLPDICTKFFPEFKGNQQKLSSYFQPVSSVCESKTENNENQMQVGLKRKLNDTKPKSLSNKKSSSDKQIKLDSFFMAKPKDKEKNVEVSTECNSYSKENWLSSLNPDITNSSSQSSDSSQNRSQETECVVNKDSFSLLSESRNVGKMLENDSISKPKNAGWNFLMKGPKPPPLCPGHGEPAAVRTVKKKGPNMNRQFYACARGAGREGDPNAQCKFFQWVGKK